MKILADDGTEFHSTDECLAYEARMPAIKLLAEVKALARTDSYVADELEKFGKILTQERIAKGLRKRPGRGKSDTAPATSEDATATETDPQTVDREEGFGEYDDEAA